MECYNKTQTSISQDLNPKSPTIGSLALEVSIQSDAIRSDGKNIISD